MSEDDITETTPLATTTAKATSHTRTILAAAAIATASGIGGYLVGAGTADTAATPATSTSTTSTSTTSPVPEQTPIETAAAVCHITSNVRDDGETIVFDTEGNDDFSGDTIADVACVLFELDTPDRVISSIDSTRALDGTLEDSWDIYRARWNYHPDTGMNLTVWIDE